MLPNELTPEEIDLTRGGSNTIAVDGPILSVVQEVVRSVHADDRESVLINVRRSIKREHNKPGGIG